MQCSFSRLILVWGGQIKGTMLNCPEPKRTPDVLRHKGWVWVKTQRLHCGVRRLLLLFIFYDKTWSKSLLETLWDIRQHGICANREWLNILNVSPYRTSDGGNVVINKKLTKKLWCSSELQGFVFANCGTCLWRRSFLQVLEFLFWPTLCVQNYRDKHEMNCRLPQSHINGMLIYAMLAKKHVPWYAMYAICMVRCPRGPMMVMVKWLALLAEVKASGKACLTQRTLNEIYSICSKRTPESFELHRKLPLRGFKHTLCPLPHSLQEAY